MVSVCLQFVLSVRCCSLQNGLCIIRKFISADTASISLVQTAYTVNESTPYISVCAVLSSCIEVYMPTVTLATADDDALGKFVVTLIKKEMFMLTIVHVMQMD